MEGRNEGDDVFTGQSSIQSLEGVKILLDNTAKRNSREIVTDVGCMQQTRRKNNVIGVTLIFLSDYKKLTSAQRLQLVEVFEAIRSSKSIGFSSSKTHRPVP